MRYNAWATVLIGLSALCLTACSVSRQATNSSSELRVESLESVEKVDSVVVEVRDTLREVTTITIDRNDKGDTLKVVQVTDRERLSSKADVRSQKVDVKVVRDTVYVEKRDSVYIKNTNLANDTNKNSSIVQGLKWIFWIIIGLIGLIITVKVCLRKW